MNLATYEYRYRVLPLYPFARWQGFCEHGKEWKISRLSDWLVAVEIGLRSFCERSPKRCYSMSKMAADRLFQRLGQKLRCGSCFDGAECTLQCWAGRQARSSNKGLLLLSALSRSRHEENVALASIRVPNCLINVNFIWYKHVTESNPQP
jgi:hypothetical protein